MTFRHHQHHLRTILYIYIYLLNHFHTNTYRHTHTPTMSNHSICSFQVPFHSYHCAFASSFFLGRCCTHFPSSIGDSVRNVCISLENNLNERRKKGKKSTWHLCHFDDKSIDWFVQRRIYAVHTWHRYVIGNERRKKLLCRGKKSTRLSRREIIHKKVRFNGKSMVKNGEKKPEMAGEKKRGRLMLMAIKVYQKDEKKQST